MYFYIHFITELVCFFLLSRYIQREIFVWLLFLTYDMLAFVPQALLGWFSDRHLKLPLGFSGLLMLALALIFNNCFTSPVPWLVILCLGNACIHVNGAEVTLRSAEGKLFPAGLFVSGGSFGLICGRLLAGTSLPSLFLLIAIASALPLSLLAQRYLPKQTSPTAPTCGAFRYAKPDLPAVAVLLPAVFVVAVRGYMAYGIPTAWIQTNLQVVLLYSAMGIGKAMGGLSADLLGTKTTALCSSLIALPFLLLGDQYMLISLIGVLLFSMTMPVTLGLLVSILPSHPGLAFGLTTIGLFLGTLPMFFFRFTTTLANGILIAICTLLCAGALQWIMKEDSFHA